MTTRQTAIWSAAGLIVGLAAATPAQAQAPLVLTLEDAVARGKAEAPRLGEARARIAAADAATDARASLKRPTASANTGYLRTNHVPEFGVPAAGGGTRIIFPDIPDNYRARAELNVPIYTSGRVDALVASAQADERAADADRRTTEADVAFETARAYWALALARADVGVLEQALQRADAQLGDVRSRVEAGVLPPNDLQSSQAQRARQFVRLIQVRNVAAFAEAELGRLVGAAPGQAIALATPVDRPTPVQAGGAAAATLDLNALVSVATAQRAERDAIAARQSALISTGEAALAATRPQIGALAAVEPAWPNPRFVPRADQWHTSWDLGVNLSWNFFDAGRARAERASVTAQADALGFRLKEFDQVLQLDIRQRLLDFESHQAALAASGEAVTAAAEARRVIEQRFAAGVATSTDVLDAQLDLVEAEIERTRLQVQLRLDEARLLRALGGS